MNSNSNRRTHACCFLSSLLLNIMPPSLPIFQRLEFLPPLALPSQPFLATAFSSPLPFAWLFRVSLQSILAFFPHFSELCRPLCPGVLSTALFKLWHRLHRFLKKYCVIQLVESRQGQIKLNAFRQRLGRFVAVGIGFFEMNGQNIPAAIVSSKD